MVQDESVRVQGTVPKAVLEQVREECPGLADDDSALLTHVLQQFVRDRKLDRMRATRRYPERDCADSDASEQNNENI